MKDVVRAILRSIGVNLADVTFRESANGLMIPTNDWNIRFVYEGCVTELELTKLGTKEACMSFFEDHDGYPVKYHVEELADITAEELYEIIKDCISR